MVHTICMKYNFAFQIAGFILVSLIIAMFFSKKRWSSLPNTIFKALLISTLLELACDIISVITITDRAYVLPSINDFFSKGYIILMHLWIVLVLCYVIASFLESAWAVKGIDIRQNKKRLFMHYLWILIPEAVMLVIVLLTPVYYAGEGQAIYSYGIPSTCTYIYSSYCVVVALVYFFVNFKVVPVKRKITLLSFTLMEGCVALLQSIFPEMLILGFGTAVCIFIMYMNMENPDLEMIARLKAANDKSDKLLKNILPQKIADSLKDDMTEAGGLAEKVIEEFDDVTVAFMDIVGFTELSNAIGHVKTVDLLNEFFSQIDELLDSYRVEKIKTIGDAYMVAAGVPERYEGHQEEMLHFLFAVQDLIVRFNSAHQTFPDLSLRIGANSGPVVAGVIGEKKFVYDMWGATVNFASRMESNGEPSRIQISTALYAKLLQSPTVSGNFLFQKREAVEIKGCGQCTTYFVTSTQRL